MTLWFLGPIVKMSLRVGWRVGWFREPGSRVKTESVRTHVISEKYSKNYSLIKNSFKVKKKKTTKKTKETLWLNVRCHPEWDPRTEKKEIRKELVKRTSVGFCPLASASSSCKMMPLGETGWGIRMTALYHLCNCSIFVTVL